MAPLEKPQKGEASLADKAGVTCPPGGARQDLTEVSAGLQRRPGVEFLVLQGRIIIAAHTVHLCLDR